MTTASATAAIGHGSGAFFRPAVVFSIVGPRATPGPARFAGIPAVTQSSLVAPRMRPRATSRLSGGDRAARRGPASGSGSGRSASARRGASATTAAGPPWSARTPSWPGSPARFSVWSGSASRSNSSGGITSGSAANCTYFQRSPRTTLRQHCSIGTPSRSSARWAVGLRKSHSQWHSVRQSAGRRAVVQERRQVAPVALERHLDPHPREDRRHHVDVLGERAHHGAPGRRRRRPRIAHDQGHVVALVPVAELLAPASGRPSGRRGPT